VRCSTRSRDCQRMNAIAQDRRLNARCRESFQTGLIASLHKDRPAGSSRTARRPASQPTKKKKKGCRLVTLMISRNMIAPKPKVSLWRSCSTAKGFRLASLIRQRGQPRFRTLRAEHSLWDQDASTLISRALISPVLRATSARVIYHYDAQGPLTERFTSSIDTHAPARLWCSGPSWAKWP